MEAGRPSSCIIQQMHQGIMLCLCYVYKAFHDFFSLFKIAKAKFFIIFIIFFHQTFKKAKAESQRLEDLSSERGCPENIVHQWVHDVRQWATDATLFYGHSSK